MDRNNNGSQKVGVYVDVSNIAQNGGYGMHYDVLREFACRNNGTAMRLNAYVAFDEDEAKHNPDYRKKAYNFHSVLRDFGYKVIVKTVRWYTDESGHVYGKANADLDMAVDALLQSERLDYVLLVTGDGDFGKVVNALQNNGCRVEVLAFKNVSHLLKREADVFTSGYLVPYLLPIDVDNEMPNGMPKKDDKPWGGAGSRVRGICYSFNHDKGYGFMRYMKTVSSGLWITDSRKNDSPYGTCFVHYTKLQDEIDLNVLPTRDRVFEFDIIDSDKGLQAVNVKLVYHY